MIHSPTSWSSTGKRTLQASSPLKSSRDGADEMSLSEGGFIVIRRR